MFNNVALDVCIGLVFIFLIHSLLVTIIGEMVSTWLGVRARILRIAIERMLNDGYYVKLENEKNKLFQGWLRRVLLYEPDEFKTSLAGRFYEYPSIKYLGRIEQAHRGVFSLTKPSYFTAENFADTIINLLKDKGVGETDMEKIQFCLKFNSLNIEPKTLKQIRNIYTNSQNDFLNYKMNLMKWFNETMDRANGWYKRKIQFILFWLGFMIAVCFNVDTISITMKLSKDKQAREQLVQMGIQSADPNSPMSKAVAGSSDTSVNKDSIWRESYKQVKLAEKDANKVLGLGWDETRPEKLTLFKKSFYYYRQANPLRKEFWGLIITGLAISLGAPFWFDLLKKLVAIRGSGVKPEEKKPDTNTFQEPDTASAKARNYVVTTHQPLNDLAEEALEKFGPSIRSIPGVKSIFPVIEKGIKKIQLNVDSSLSADILKKKLPELLVYDQLIPHKIVISGTPVSHIGEKGTILNKSRNNGFGSLGCMLRRTDTGTVHVLSCWHVMKSDINYSDLDDEVTILDHKGNEFADRWAGGIQGAYDYAIARCTLPQEENYNLFLKNKLAIEGLIKPRQINRRDVEEQIGIKYYDCLSETVRKGFIYAEADSVDIHYLDRTRRINDVLILTDDNERSISKAGNSGAIIFDNENTAIAMIISGDINYTYAVKLSHIFRIHNEMHIA
jgi:hypothetical protein